MLKPIKMSGKTISVSLSADDLKQLNALREKGYGQTEIFRRGMLSVEDSIKDLKNEIERS